MNIDIPDPPRERPWKPVLLTIMAIVIVIGVAVSTAYAKHTVMPYDKPLDLSVLSDKNTARREQLIEQADYATVVITSISGEDDTFTVTADFPGYPDTWCYLYLATDDLVKLDIGDTVKVKGRIKYYQNAWDNDYIVIGDAVDGKPLYDGDARVVEIMDKEGTAA